MSEPARRRHFGKRIGRYVLGSQLGAGGAAAVYLARLDGPHGFERICALKVVHEHLLAERELVAMILDEANLAVRLSHPGIVHSYELGHSDDFLFIAMEYLHGQPLSRVYQRAQQSGSALPYDLVAWLGARAAEALHYAHSLCDSDGTPLGIVHRDVSPDNLFISYDGELKLIDFGIARAEQRLSRTRLGELKGKFRYMAAEYALGEQFDHRLDLFALGATLYEAALGVPAFGGELDSQVLAQVLSGTITKASELRPDFPAALWSVLERSLSAAADDRFADGASFARALEAAVPCDASQARRRLAELVRGLFPDELDRANAELIELRGLSHEPEATTSHGQTVSGPREHGSGSRRVAGGVALALTLAAALLFWRAREHEASPFSAQPSALPAPAAASSAVELGVLVEPAVPASVWIGGVEARGVPARVNAARGTTPLDVSIQAAGYRGVTFTVVPDRDRTLSVALTAASASPVLSAPATPVTPSATAANTAAAGARPAAPPAASAAGRGGLIKKYPF